ncbi:hypothetical protein F2P81_016748 [Scophthalmus maximus]|uniref:Uncharacterized protein n=1 Tax=Scophthalmus maximus TaxID=52904 RepID=A0A6A4SA14_SCOMX|nr:hypothetical protein F2P81_016748 [Scophthalmus maximus]
MQHLWLRMGFQSEGSATGIFRYQYSFVWTGLPSDAAIRPSSLDRVTSCVVTYEGETEEHSELYIVTPSRTNVCR